MQLIAFMGHLKRDSRAGAVEAGIAIFSLAEGTMSLSVPEAQ